MWVNPAQPPSVSRCAPRSRSPVSLIVLTRSCSCRWGPCPSPTPRLACPFYLFIYGKRTAASGVAWSGCASLRGPLCAGEALLEARTQASVALFKLGAHSATLRPEFGGPKSLRCCCAKGVGHRAQLMLRARRGDRENNHPVPLLRTPTNTTKRSLSPVLTQGGHNYQVPRLAATGRSCHRAQLETLPLNRHPPPPAPAPLLLPRELNRSKRAIASWRAPGARLSAATSTAESAS